MKTIAIELNHVVRNINKQFVRYYFRDYDTSLTEEEFEEIDSIKENVLDKYIKFTNKCDLQQFIYEDYPYELFGCANPIDKDLPSKINTWLYNITNYEKEDIRVIYFSLYEDALTIQSTYFFLSKIGTRVRTMLFPKDIKEVYKIADAIITTNRDILVKSPRRIKRILINNNGTRSKCATKSMINYDSLNDLINDKNFLDNICNNKNIKR